MTLQERLRANPLKDIIIPVIAAMQGKYVTYEMKAAVAEILSVKSDNWGLKVLGTAPPRFIKIDPSPRPPKKKPPVSPTDLVNNSGVQSDIALLRTLREKLDSIDTTLPNSWIWFNEISEMYYGLVPFIDYFSTTFEDGRYVDDILYSTGLALRPGASLNGIVFTDLKDGATGGTAAVHNIGIGSLGLSDAGSYFSMHTPDGEDQHQVIFWYTVDGSGVQPSLPVVAGVTNSYVEVAVLSSDPASGVANKTRQIIEGVAGTYGFDTVVWLEVSIIVTNLINGAVSQPQIQMPVGFPTWSINLTNGTDGVETIAQTRLDFSTVIIEDLNSKGFSLKDTGAERVYGVWFSLDYDPGVEPVIPGVDSGYIQIGIKASDTISDIIVTLNNAIKNIVGDLTIKEDTLTIEADTALDGVFIDGFNAAKGSGGENDIYGADGTLLYTSPNDSLPDAFYIVEWNAKKVPYDESIGVFTPYLKSGGSGLTSVLGRGACNSLCGPQPPIGENATLEESQTWYTWERCNDKCYRANGVTPPAGGDGILYASTAKNDSTTLKFNTPPRTRRNSRRSNRPGPI